ncbi:MAG: NAD(P)-dependent oxidoreductase [Bacteroidota bacterium]
MKIGIIREGKNPPDSRVPLIPSQCAELINNKQLNLVVQASPIRCYTDQEYKDAGVPVVEKVDDCDVLLGVKEVPIEQLIADKGYFFFSHTFKEQPYNRELLQAILKKNITLMDYEVLTDEQGKRVIAFGYFAGMVGAYNGLLTYGRRSGTFSLKRMKDCYDYAEAKQQFPFIQIPPIKIVLTGTGRVASGAAKVLEDMGIPKVAPNDFIIKEFGHVVFTQLDCKDYAARKDGSTFDLPHFFKNPSDYKSIFQPYTKVANLMINGIYWDSAAPPFFTKKEMKSSDFTIEVIADVTCDIAPEASIPATIKPSTIADPIFGYNPFTASEIHPFQQQSIDMMTIDNLPNELPRDASKAFGEQFIKSVLDDLLSPQKEGVIERGTMTKGGQLTERFAYLQNYVAG